MYEHVLPHRTQQYDGGDETKVVYSEVKITPEVKEDVATQVDEKGKVEVAAQVDEKVKEATQTTEGMQRDEGELTDQKEMGEEESECMHVEILFYIIITAGHISLAYAGQLFNHSNNIWHFITQIISYT